MTPELWQVLFPPVPTGTGTPSVTKESWTLVQETSKRLGFHVHGAPSTSRGSRSQLGSRGVKTWRVGQGASVPNRGSYLKSPWKLSRKRRPPKNETTHHTGTVGDRHRQVYTSGVSISVVPGPAPAPSGSCFIRTALRRRPTPLPYTPGWVVPVVLLTTPRRPRNPAEDDSPSDSPRPRPLEWV